MRLSQLSLALGRGVYGRVDAPSIPAAALFSFSDNFNTNDGILRDRSGWLFDTVDLRTQSSSVSSGLATLSDLTGFENSQHYVDVGRHDGCVADIVIGSSAQPYILSFNYCTERDYLRVVLEADRKRLRLFRVIGGTSTAIYDTFVLGAEIGPVGTKVGVSCSWTGSTCNVQLFVNDVRYPNASTSWNVTASGYLQPSGRVGLMGRTVADSFSVAALSIAPTIRLQKVNRIIQRDKTTGLGTLDIQGVTKGTRAIQVRLLQSNAVVSGWDWGQRALTGLVIDGTTGEFTCSLVGIPVGAEYVVEMRDTDDPLAASRTRRFDVGSIWLLVGQSLATQAWAAGSGGRTIAAQDSAWFPGSGSPATDQRDNPFSFAGEYDFRGKVNGGSTVLNNTGVSAWALQVRQSSTIPIAMRVVGYGSRSLINFLDTSTNVPYGAGPSRTIWQNLVETIQCFGDIEGILFSQGQEDAGRAYNTNVFGVAEANAYKTNFTKFVNDVRTLTGRSAAQLPVLVFVLGRCYPPSGTIGNYAADSAYDLFRKTQFELSNTLENVVLSHNQIDLDMASTTTNEVHLSGSTDKGYVEDLSRSGAAIAKHMGYAVTDRSGPRPELFSRVGNDISITYDANGCSDITCSASVASNVVFWTDNTYTTQLTPSSMSIGSLTAGKITVTWTFASTSAGNVITSGKGGAYSTGGIWPDVANALKGTLADTRKVITWPIFEPVVLA